MLPHSFTGLPLLLMRGMGPFIWHYGTSSLGAFPLGQKDCMVVMRRVQCEPEIYINLGTFLRKRIQITKLLRPSQSLGKGQRKCHNLHFKLQQVQSRPASETSSYDLLCQFVPETFHLWLSLQQTSKDGLS